MKPSIRLILKSALVLFIVGLQSAMAQTCTSAPSGLIGWWPGDGTAADLVGTNHGVAIRDTTYVSGKVGQAFSFDGNDAVIITNRPAFQLQSFTIEAWVKRSDLTKVSTDPYGAGIFGYGEHGYILALTPSGQVTLSKVNVSGVSSPFYITNLNYHHIAVTKSNSTVTFYLDGQASAPQTYNTTFAFFTNLGIGNRGDLDLDGFLGTIDEVALYNRPLSSAEIQAIYNADSAGKCPIGLPVIVQQPISQNVVIGQGGTFSVIASNGVNYQWQFNGSNIVAATTSVLSLSNVTTNDAGAYSVLVSNPNGSVASSNATLTVIPPTCVAPVSGLVGWWAGTGNALDSVGTNHGVLVGNTTYASGKVGQAFVFDGDDAVIITNRPEFQLQTFTIEAWVKRSSLTQVSTDPFGAAIFGYGEHGYVLALTPGGQVVLSKVNIDGVNSPFYLTNLNYHHIAVTKSGSTVTFYLDGQASTPQTYNNTFTFFTNLGIGNRGDLDRDGFLGAIDEVALYNRALSDSEIQAIYHADVEGRCSTGILPTIVQQPSSQTVLAGQPATFSVLVSNVVTYQWKFNGTNIATATSSALSLANATTNNAGIYTVEVSNPNGSIISSNAVLTVNLPPSCASPVTGLVAWWTGDGNALDFVNTNHGSLVGNVTNVTAKVGQGFVFDGTGDAINVAASPALQLQNFTIEAWLKRNNTNLASQPAGFGGFIYGHGWDGYCFGVQDDGHLYLAKVGRSLVVGSPQITDLNFHHVAVTKSGTNVIFYLDGVASPGMTYTDTFLFLTEGAIGGAPDGEWSSFIGILDEVAIYNRPLTGAELQSIHAAGSLGKCKTGVPTIIQQPVSQTADIGETITLTVLANNASSYQWQINSTNIASATGSALVLSNVTTNDSGNYAVLVSNTNGSILSSNALLTVLTQRECTTPPSGIVGWWTGSSNPSDLVGTNHGVMVGSTTYATAKVGQGFVFDGTGDAVNVGVSPALQLQNFTIEAWVKRNNTSLASQPAGFGGFIYGHGWDGFCFGVQDDGRLYLGKVGRNLVNATQQITDLNFHHVAVTKNGSSVIFYLDGVAAPTINYGETFAFTSAAAIGGAPDGGWSSFIGVLDEVAIYNRPLVTAEIQSLYEARSAGKCYVGPVPAIVQQPASQTVLAGQSVTFSVGASNALSYQWIFNGTNITSATNSALNLSNVATNDAGIYEVLVSNTNGSVLSSNAVLTVNLPSCVAPVSGLIGWWAGNGNAFDAVGTNHGVAIRDTTYVSGKVGQAFSFDGNDAVIITNRPAFQLQSFTIEAWVKRSSLTQVSTDPYGAGIFGYGEHGYILALTPAGRVTLSKVNIDGVSSPFYITNLNYHHIAVTKSNSTVTFYLDGQASAPQTYNTTFAFFTNLGIGNRGDLDLDGFLGSIDEVALYNRPLSSSEIQAIYNADSYGKCNTAPPVIGQQPASITVNVGESAMFTVQALNADSYQWQFNGSNIVSATASALILPNVTTNDAGNYAVLVSNTNGSVLSSNAVLTVNIPPQCIDPVAGMIGSWTANGNALDSVGTNHGILVGNTTYTTGKAGQAFTFDGDDAVIITNKPEFQLQNFTIEAWVKRSSMAQVSTDPFGAGIFGYGAHGYILALTPAGRIVLSKVNVDGVSSPFYLTNLNYHHIAVTKNGSNVVFYMDGQTSAPLTYNGTFSFQTHVGIGNRGDLDRDGFLGAIDEVALYNRALTSSEISAIYTASSAGKCHVPVAPFIITQPSDRTTTRGSNVTFNVLAGGSVPLAYQWSFNGTNISGATDASLTLTNVQLGQAGSYAVLVTNAAGSVLSSNAALTVQLPPALVQVVSTNGMSGGIVRVPITLSANGNENALGFSLTFNTQQLSVVEVNLGSGASGASILLNTNSVATGKLGIAVALPANSTFALGTHEVVVVDFASAPATNAVVANVGFGDTPTLRQVSDAQALVLPATYVGGTISLALSDFEGDTTPRPTGDHAVTITDWVQVGRFAANLDTPAVGGEFQRADSAPRSGLGNGKISVTDWVQAGRYAAGLDPLTVVGGPDAPSGSGARGANSKVSASNVTGARELVLSGGAIQGLPSTIAVYLQAQGDENALGFSVAFDTNKFTYVSASLGSAAASGTLHVNTSIVESGKLGLTLALPIGAHFSAGSREIVKINLTPITGAIGSSNIVFGDQPVAREVSDTGANELSANYVSALVVINPLPTLSLATTSSSVSVSWPAWAEGFSLQTSGTNALGTWSNATGSLSTNNGNIILTLPLGSGNEYFRLRRP